ncbi:hypothetical protein [Krasilnikovia sp. MM14-A1004]|uniref:hypothetical protein n=1 Tax=Krasilnikovia sp. MM14-A1004 TaxID=3373541 RepID=UPI00399C984D
MGKGSAVVGRYAAQSVCFGCLAAAGWPWLKPQASATPRRQTTQDREASEIKGRSFTGMADDRNSPISGRRSIPALEGTVLGLGVVAAPDSLCMCQATRSAQKPVIERIWYLVR